MRRRWSSPDDRHPPCHARADAVGFARAGGVRVRGHGCRRGGHRAACGGRACRPRRRGPAGDWRRRPRGPRGRPAPEPASARGGGAGKAGRPLHSARGSARTGSEARSRSSPRSRHGFWPRASTRPPRSPPASASAGQADSRSPRAGAPTTLPSTPSTCSGRGTASWSPWPRHRCSPTTRDLRAWTASA